MVSTSKTPVGDLQGGNYFLRGLHVAQRRGGFEIHSHLYKLVSLFPLNRNTILMSKKLEPYLCTPLSFFLDCVCQRNESPSNIALSFRAYPCFCIQYTALRGLGRPRQASKLICWEIRGF